MKFDDTAAPQTETISGRLAPDLIIGDRHFSSERVAAIRSCDHQIGIAILTDGTRDQVCFECGTRSIDLAEIDPNWQQRTKMNDTADNVTPIRKTDEAISAEIRAELAPILDAAASVMNKGRAAGLTINFGMGLDAYGRYKVMSIDILKPL